MNVDWSRISHITKVDPAKSLPDDLEVLEGTDLIIVGGSDGVTAENTLETVEAVGDAYPDRPVWQEPYSADHVSTDTIEAVDHVSVPAVYNGNRKHFVGKHVELFTEVGQKPEELFGSSLPVVGNFVASKGASVVSTLTEKVVGEGYVVQHLESEAANVAGVDSKYTPEQVAGAALATESFYGFPVFYVEYSGTYGGPADVEAASTYLSETTLLYGGGIDSAEKATEILEAGADAIVVGDCFHEDPERFRETIPA
ncbi:geranylgeranylglyceryl/heptaprenylglyceryl phosphate synthase [Natronobacterium gregoryi]|uniref:phosphoglycerol geranylgeranyltransferase n=2 Tax=Natronobacterium gregoryi TaxID=44930 RepID=L0ADB2_NATGS|nr:heptaprenylglyceryl phosphate synthase [Natronobacterium gregoryi]AFZ71841.1 geranylgeranylglyceryl phosphate synthase family protein [Natronobacterium gregoryi SP2]ELY72985.1 geranylgeranylglyceryl phosphate synthase-like protein [Natronobacterium gregoryi SP2]PLK19128.1 heptaprenylglyceryl phosphate synthase [Natronobacterium gregoryi SP2]SFJ60185.1 geranylgeranylglyceryl diphosphate synthase [Natronobacterium gregoryi]